MTGRRNDPVHAAHKNVSHMTDIPADAGEIVGTAWDALRAALRIPDADRQEGGKYTTSSGRLFDFIGERVRRAARDGALEELIPFRDAAVAVERDVRVGDNGLAPNYFSKVLGRWKAGEGAAKGEAVQHAKRGETDYLMLPSPPYRVLFEIRGPKETDPTQRLERPASVRWSIELGGVPVLPDALRRDKALTIAGNDAPLTPPSSDGGEGDALRNPALFTAGMEDAARGIKRMEQASADPTVRKTTREMSRLLQRLGRLSVLGKLAVGLILLAVPYTAFPEVRLEVNTIVKTAIDYWFRVTTRGGSRLTIHKFSGTPVYQPDPAWLAEGEPLRILHATKWPFDDDERVRILKESVKIAGGDPGMVSMARLKWHGGVKGSIVRDVSAGPGLVRLLAVPSPSNRYTSLTYVMTISGIDPKTLQLRSKFTTTVDGPHLGVQDLTKDDFGHVITITMIPTELLMGGQKSIADECEFVELFIENDENGKLIGFAPPAASGGVEFRVP